MPSNLSEMARDELVAALQKDVSGAQLRSLTLQWFGKPLDLLIPGTTIEDAPAQLIGWVHENDEARKLLRGLMTDLPGAPSVARFLQGYRSKGKTGLQKAFNLDDVQISDIRGYVARFTERRRQVCKVLIDRKPAGTGLLIGPDRVLTAFHVVAGCIEERESKPGSATLISCSFDELVDADDTVLAAAVTIPAAANWLGPHCPTHPNDGEVLELPDEPDALTHLDYAVVNLATTFGSAPFNPKGGAPRGWHDLDASAGARLETGVKLEIFQHPAGQELSLSKGAVQSLDNKKSRVRYDAETLDASSGSPCFNHRLDAIALHNAALPDDVKLNQGVPMKLIREHIMANGGLPSADPPLAAMVWQLADGSAVLGRQGLQELAWSMRELRSPKRILTVLGKEKTGRSFSTDLLKAVFANGPEVVVERKAEALCDNTPENFLLELARELKLPTDAPNRPDDRQSARWASTKMLEWFVKRFADVYPSTAPGAFTVWVTLDDADRHPMKSDESNDILVQLLRATPGLETLRWLVIGKSPDPSLVPMSLVAEEPILEPTDADVGAYLKAVRDAGNKTTADAAIDGMAPGVRLTAPIHFPPPTPFLKALQAQATILGRGLR